MENWIIGVRFVAILYCIYHYAMGDMENIPMAVLSVLLYICAGMLFYVFRKAVPKKLVLIFALAVVVASAVFLNSLFMFLLPVTILDFAACYTGDIRLWAAAILLSLLFCPAGRLEDYILISLLCLAVFVLARKVYASTAALKAENGRLREKNEALGSKLDRGEEYENQLRYLSQLEERNNLAQSIHDKVGHTLAGSLIQLEAASMIIESDREKARAILGSVIDHLKDGMESTRSTLRSIKPPSEQLGVNRLKTLLDEFSLDNPIKATLVCKGRLDAITNTYWRIITDNTKEALTNALKYSHANDIRVSIEILNRLVKIEIRDNGTGAPLTIKKGLGITGMEERTEAAGGELIIDGSKGFSIIMLLPVGEVANADKSVDS